MSELIRDIRTAKDIAMPPKGRKIALMEGPSGCNRACSYCTVPQRWNAETASTLDQSRRQVDWLYDQGYRILNYYGGEPLSPKLQTKEGLTFAEHTLGVVEHAADTGMRVNVTTNGDYAKEDILEQLHDAGVDMLTFSLHTLTNRGFDRLMTGAKLAAEKKIVPDINVVFTKDRVDLLPRIAAACAQNGVLFSTSVVQEYGGGFSSVPEQSQIPTIEEQKEVFGTLGVLKRAGLVRNNMRYLTEATDYPGNSWKCDPEKDSFVYLRAEGDGEIGVCLEVQTDFTTADTQMDDDKWRDAKRDLVADCNNCLYNGTFGSENGGMRGEIPTLANMFLIKAGQSERVQRKGKRAAEKLKQQGVDISEGNIFSR